MHFFINLTILRIVYLVLISLQVVYTPYTFTKSKGTIPVIFVHWGNADFLKHSLWQAKQFNKRVILLGDPSTQHYKNLGIEWHNVEDYSKSSNYFASIYVHISLVRYDQEIRCFQRWFALEEFMKKNNIPVAFHAESDVMLYCDISKEYTNNFKQYDVSLVSSGRGYRGGMVSYWNTKAIKSFTAYLINHYRNRDKVAAALRKFKKDDPNTHYQDDEPFMLYFAQDTVSTLKIGEINKIIHNALFDFIIRFNFNQEANGSMVYFTMKKYPDPSLQTKDIHLIKGLPYCYSPTLQKDLRFKSLHFQASAKNFMGDYRVKKNA